MAVVATGMITLTDLNDSQQVQFYLSTPKKNQFYNPNTGGYDPHYPTNKPVITPNLFIGGLTGNQMTATQVSNIKWYVDGVEITGANADYTIAATGVKTLTVNTNVLASVNERVYVCEFDFLDTNINETVKVRADISLTKVTLGQTGAAAIMAMLSNETHTLPASFAGVVSTFAGATTTLSIFEGTTDVTASWTIAQTRTACTVTEATTSRTATVTAVSADQASVTFTATRSGYATITKTFNLSKSKQGDVGQNATAYWLVPSEGVIKRKTDLSYASNTITVTAKSQVGTAAPTNYSGRFIISETTNGSTWVAKYTSSANEASKVYTVTASTAGAKVVAVKVALYVAGATTNLLDEEIIYVVDDGSEPVYIDVWTPEGDIVKNGKGTVKIEADVYKGGVIQSSGVTYEWFLQDASQLTDVGGGIGFKKIDATFNLGVTNYTTGIITVPATAIPTQEIFKCVATFEGNKYPATVSVFDVTEEVTVTIFGANIIKNGEGSITLEAILRRNNEIIDQGGTLFTYQWAMYDQANNVVAGFNPTTKQITVLASQVSGVRNVVCEVTEK